MIDPSFWRDEKVAQCTYMERLLFEGLWTFAEDNGVGRAGPLLIKADVFPYDTLRASDIEKSLDKLSSLEMILLYEIDGQKYYYLLHFDRHQKINRPSVCTLPKPTNEMLIEYSLTTHGGLTPNISKDNISIYTIDETMIDEIWSLYPNKKGKGTYLKKITAIVEKYGFEHIKRTVERYSDEVNGQDLKYVKHGDTFFNGGYIDYLDENYQQSKQNDGWGGIQTLE